MPLCSRSEGIRGQRLRPLPSGAVWRSPCWNLLWMPRRPRSQDPGLQPQQRISRRYRWSIHRSCRRSLRSFPQACSRQCKLRMQHPDPDRRSIHGTRSGSAHTQQRSRTVWSGTYCQHSSYLQQLHTERRLQFPWGPACPSLLMCCRHWRISRRRARHPGN